MTHIRKRRLPRGKPEYPKRTHVCHLFGDALIKYIEEFNELNGFASSFYIINNERIKI